MFLFLGCSHYDNVVKIESQLETLKNLVAILDTSNLSAVQQSIIANLQTWSDEQTRNGLHKCSKVW